MNLGSPVLVREFFKYGLVQVAAYLIDYGVFALGFLVLGAPGVPANVVAKICAGLFAFSLHKTFTFRVGGDRAGAQAMKYFALLAVNIPLVNGVFWGLSFVMDELLAKLAADVVMVLLTFLISRSFVFTRAGEASAPR